MTPATLEEIYIRTSRCGNTTALVAFAKAHGAIVVVHDAHEEARVRALGAKAVSIERGPRAFLGTTAGYVIDLPVFAAVSREWEAAISARRAAERECDEQRVRAEVAERRAATAETTVERLTMALIDLAPDPAPEVNDGTPIATLCARDARLLRALIGLTR